MICAWTHRSDGGGGMVYPDGCRDVIMRRPVDGPRQVLFSTFDRVPRYVASETGTVFEGYRLPPGAGLDAAAQRHLTGQNAMRFDDIIADYMVFPTDVSHAIEALSAPGVTVAQASRHLGLPLRRLERMMRRHGQPSPAVWQQLARARRSVLQIAHSSESFAEIAAVAGYSDQAHLTRAVRRWFGTTPGQLRLDPALQSRLCQPGLGTGEHISIK